MKLLPIPPTSKIYFLQFRAVTIQHEEIQRPLSPFKDITLEIQTAPTLYEYFARMLMKLDSSMKRSHPLISSSADMFTQIFHAFSPVTRGKLHTYDGQSSYVSIARRYCFVAPHVRKTIIIPEAFYSQQILTILIIGNKEKPKLVQGCGSIPSS